MANRWLFAGGGQEQARVIAGTVTTSTTTSLFDAAYADHGVAPNAATSRFAYDFVDGDTAVMGETVSFRFTAGRNTGAPANSTFNVLYDSAGFPWIAMRTTATAGVVALFYNSGTGVAPVWTQLGTTTIAFSSGRYVVVISLTLGSPHTLSWSVFSYSTGSTDLIENGITFTQASLTNIAGIEINNVGSSTSLLFYSEIAAAVGFNLTGSHIKMCKPNAAGANSGFTGTSADIDDTTTNDTDAISSAVAGQRSTFGYTDLPVLSANESLGDTFLVTRARNDGASPTNIKPVRRSAGGVDTVGAAFVDITTAYKTFTVKYPGLSKAEIDGGQFGVESAA